MAIYITCTRKKGLQKKHIDICRRCDSNTSCRSYQDYKRNNPKTENRESLIITEKYPLGGDLLRDIVKEFKEIQKILGAVNAGDQSFQIKISDNTPPLHISIDLLKKELKIIKALYHTAPPQLLNHNLKGTSNDIR